MRTSQLGAMVALLGVVSARDGRAGEAAGPRVSVALFVVAGDKVSDEAQAEIVRGLENALEDNQRIAVKETDLLLAEFAGEVPAEAISEARALYDGALELMDQGRVDAATVKLEGAELAFESVLAYAKKSELADVQFLLGVAYLAGGDKKSAQEAFARLRAWRPTFVVDVDKYPKVLPVWETVGQDLEAAGRGSVEIKSKPAGAMVYVDGKYAGVTPTVAEGLTAGDHYVTLKKDGWQRRLVKVTASAKEQQQVNEKLLKSDKYLLLSQSLERAEPTLGENRASAAVQDLRTFLFIDQAVFVRVDKGKKKGTHVASAYLYDLRSRRLLKSVTRATIPAAGKDAAKKLAELATTLYAGARYDGKTSEDDRLARAARGEGGHDDKLPLTSRWWFWTMVGVGLGVAVPLTIYAAGGFDSPAPSCPPGEVCGTVLIDY